MSSDWDDGDVQAGHVSLILRRLDDIEAQLMDIDESIRFHARAVLMQAASEGSNIFEPREYAKRVRQLEDALEAEFNPKESP